MGTCKSPSVFCLPYSIYTMRSFFLVTLVLCCTILTSCSTITTLAKYYKKQQNEHLSPESMVNNGVVAKITVAKPDYWLPWSSTTISFNPQGIARINDKSFIVAIKTPSDSGVVYRYDDTLGIVWQATYANQYETESRVWYRNGQVHIISNYQGEERWSKDTLACIGRSFDVEAGTLLHSDTLVMTNYNNDYIPDFAIFSADSSALLIVVGGQEKRSFYQNRSNTREYTLQLIRPDLTATTRNISVAISPDATANFTTVFAISDRGDVLYNNFHTDDSTLSLSVIRLPMAGGEPDTLTVSTPRYTVDKDELQPDDAVFTLTPDGKIFIAWNIENDEEAAYIRLIQCDFQTHKARIFTDILFTEEMNERLFNSSSFDEPRIMGCYSLTDGGLLVLFDECQEKTRQSSSMRPDMNGNPVFSSGISINYYLAEWLCAACINSDGSIRWLRGVQRKQTGSQYTTLGSFYQESSTLHTILLDDDLYTDITFSLTDGKDTKVAFPGAEIYSDIFFPPSTLWNKDGTVVFRFNSSKDEVYIGRVHIPEMDSLSKEK